MKNSHKAVFIAAALIFSCISASCGKTDSSGKGTKTTTAAQEIFETLPDTITMPETQPAAASAVIKNQPQLTSCTAAAAYCVNTNEYIYSFNADKPVAPASLTKLLTAATALNYTTSADIMTVGSELYLVRPGSSLCYISPGLRISLHDLLTGLLLSSGNDAAYTIAVEIGRNVGCDLGMSDEEAVNVFCRLMNNFAESIGMTSSNFSTPDGWDDSAQYTTASDLVKLSKYVLNNPELRSIVGTHETTVTFENGGNAQWKNSNRLLDPTAPYYCPEATGMKTGSTIDAGNCLVASFKIDGLTYITVVTGCETDDDRYISTLELYKFIKS